ncbi:MAG TPA: signal peptidase II [Thermoanaerobaculaceae bacterium]|nr:signal peptidase II [Thermoanaerobaculaceae bacterium]HRS17619.1 signal peptidase II [Thermoanaerobaculaceae bacterium]
MLRSSLIAAAVLTVDQLTKAWIVVNYPLGWERQIVPGLFRLVHTRNRGVAFGLLGTSGPVVQIGLLVLIVVVVGYITWQLVRGGTDGATRIALSLVLGGALGNLVDRVLRGEVVDFLLFYVRSGGRELAWPAFNVADSAISVGASLVILAEILSAVRSKRVPLDR